MSPPVVVNLSLGLVAHATQVLNRQSVTFGELFERYVLPWNSSEFNWVITRASLNGFVDLSAETQDLLERRAHVTLAGWERVNSVFGENLALLLEQNGVHLKDENSSARLESSLDSSVWTGVPKALDAAAIEQILEKSGSLRAAILQSDLDERAKLNALGRISAVESLLRAPDPPWKIIVSLLNSPPLTAFLNTAAILSLIFG